VKKSIAALLAAAGLILVPLSLSAQTTANANAGFQVMSFDIGYAPAWDTNPPAGGKNFIAPALFALNVRVANNFLVGFETLTSGANIDSYLTMKYNFLPMLRGTVAFGQTSNFGAVPGTAEPAMGLGFEAVPFARTIAGSVSTEFKLAFQYLAALNDLRESALVFALAFGIGF
jgi:hypothetical protein